MATSYQLALYKHATEQWLTCLRELYCNGHGIRPQPDSVSCHSALVDVERVEVIDGELSVEGVCLRESCVGVHLCHMHCVVLDGSVGVLKGRRVPDDGEGGGCGGD